MVRLALGFENIARLRDGQPILVDGKTVGAPEVVVIVGCAESSEEFMREFTRVSLEAGASVEDLDRALKDAGINRSAPRDATKDK